MTIAINETTNTSNNPMCWVILHNTAILGVYTRPEWAATKAMSVLNEELATRTRRAVEYKLQMPDGIYVMRSGYDPDTGEIDLLFHPTVEQIEEVLVGRANTLGVTVVGIGSSVYSLNIVPVVLDA